MSANSWTLSFNTANSASSASPYWCSWSFQTAFRESNLIVFGIVLLSFWVPPVPMICGHAQEIYYSGTGQVLRGHHKMRRAHQNTTLYVYLYILGTATTRLNLIVFYSLSFCRSSAVSRHSLHNVDKRGYYTTPKSTLLRSVSPSVRIS